MAELVYNVSEAAAALGISRPAMYIAANRLKSEAGGSPSQMPPGQSQN